MASQSFPSWLMAVSGLRPRSPDCYMRALTLVSLGPSLTGSASQLCLALTSPEVTYIPLAHSCWDSKYDTDKNNHTWHL